MLKFLLSPISYFSANESLPKHVLFAIGGWKDGTTTNAIEAFNTRTEQWHPVADVSPEASRAYHGTAAVGHKIYVIGGFNEQEYFNSCLCFDLVQKKWTKVGYMRERRCYVSVVVLDGLIYAMGGYDSFQPDRHKSAESYDPASNQWSSIAPMNFARSDASAAALDGKVYIFGGFNGKEGLRSAEMYDPATDQWTVVEAMKHRRSGVRCTAFHGQIYAIGGFDGSRRLATGERYCPATNKWSPIPVMRNARSNFGIEVLDDRIYVIGGFNGDETTNGVEYFDGSTETWHEVTPMNSRRSALASCVVSYLPNLHDYFKLTTENGTILEHPSALINKALLTK